MGKTRIWCDNAAALFIKNLSNKGLNIKGCKKPKIKDSILAMLDYEWIIDPASTNLQTELDNYRWATKKADEPIDDFNHAIDGMRYAFTHKINEKVPMPL